MACQPKLELVTGLGAVCGIVAALARVPSSAIGPATGVVVIALAIIYLPRPLEAGLRQPGRIF